MCNHFFISFLFSFYALGFSKTSVKESSVGSSPLISGSKLNCWTIPLTVPLKNRKSSDLVKVSPGHLPSQRSVESYQPRIAGLEWLLFLNRLKSSSSHGQKGTEYLPPTQFFEEAWNCPESTWYCGGRRFLPSRI